MQPLPQMWPQGKLDEGGHPREQSQGHCPWPCCHRPGPAAGCALLSLFLVGASPEFNLSLQVQSRQ